MAPDDTQAMTIFSAAAVYNRVALNTGNSILFRRVMSKFLINLSEIEFSAIRARGPGGQHVNKVSTAILLRFDINKSSLPDELKLRLQNYPDKRISKDGNILIKAARFRSQDMNRQDAIDRLEKLVARAAASRKKRIATKPTKRAREKRLKDKKFTGDKKQARSSLKTLDE